jgi:hypothetical protein
LKKISCPFGAKESLNNSFHLQTCLSPKGRTFSRQVF